IPPTRAITTMSESVRWATVAPNATLGEKTTLLVRIRATLRGNQPTQRELLPSLRQLFLTTIIASLRRVNDLLFLIDFNFSCADCLQKDIVVGFVKQKWQKPVTLEELLVSTLPQGMPSRSS